MPVNTNKPTILILLGLVTLHLIYMVAGLAGMVQTTMEMPNLLLILLLDIVVLFGLYYGYAYAWWLLFFGSIYGIINNLVPTLQILPLILWFIVLACVTKKETIDEYRPNLAFLKGW